jgi:hypothetical protein
MIGIDHKGQSLRDFIEENQSLLTAMAVLFGIATFMATIPMHWLSSALLFFSIAGAITLWAELYMCFPKTGALRLILFKNIISLGLMGFILYWFLAFGAFWNLFIFVPLFAAMYYMSNTVLKQLLAVPFVKKAFGERGHRNGWQILLICGYGIGIFYGVTWMLAISIGAAPGFNLILEVIRQNFR